MWWPPPKFTHFICGRYLPKCFSKAASTPSSASASCSHSAWKCRPSMPSSSSGLNSASVTPSLLYLPHGLYRSVSTVEYCGFTRMPQLTPALKALSLNRLHWLKLLKVMWSASERIWSISPSSYAGANTWTSLPISSLASLASFKLEAVAPGRYSPMMGKLRQKLYPLRAQIILTPVLFWMSERISMFLRRRFSSRT